MLKRRVMIQTHIVHPVTGDSQQVVADITERICRPFCFLGQAQPTATVSFVPGTATVADGVAIVPMTALVTVVSPTDQPCGCAHTQVFRESFTLAFAATGTNTVTVTDGTATVVTPAYTKCCKAYGVNVKKSFVATIA